jgi:DNA-binding GntR family transcriptional regulator
MPAQQDTNLDSVYCQQTTFDIGDPYRIFFNSRDDSNQREKSMQVPSDVPGQRFRVSKNLSEQIAGYLRVQIIRGELAPGERILEAKLAETMDVSRGPIREALRILEKTRLIELTPRRGARVTSMSFIDIESLYDVLTELYTLVARKAAENRDPEDLHRIVDAVKGAEYYAAKGDPAGYYDSILDFAAAIRRASRNTLADQILQHLEPATRRTQFATLSDRVHDLAKNVTFFQKALRHIEKGNAEMAGQTIRKYAQNEKDFALRMQRKLNASETAKGS